MRRLFLGALGAAVLLLPGAVAAQVVPSPFRHIETSNSFSLTGGYFHGNAGRFDLGPRPGTILVGRYDRHLSGPLIGEVGLGVIPTRRNVYHRPGALGTPLVQVGEADLLILLAEAGLRLRLTGPRTWRGLAPYTVLTGGVVTSGTRLTEIDETLLPEQRFAFGPAFAAGFGLGTDLFLTERYSVRAEARDHFWRLGYPTALLGTDERRTEWRHNFSVSLGASIHF
jgi:hypothetical protein